MKQAYPVFIKEEESGWYLVYVPDFNQNTQGRDFLDAIDMARDLLGLNGIEIGKPGFKLPEPSSPEEAMVKAKEDADEIFDFSDGILTYVDIDFDEYEKRLYNRSVRKNCTIPFLLNERAEREGINFSRVLQEGLEAKLADKNESRAKTSNKSREYRSVAAEERVID